MTRQYSALLVGVIGLGACTGAVMDGNGRDGGPLRTGSTVPAADPGSATGGNPITVGGAPVGPHQGAATVPDTTVATGLPCAVQTVLQVRCQGCHGSQPMNGAPMSLVTLADLLAPSKSNPSRSNAQLATARMQNVAAPMPPVGLPRATAAEIQTVSDWVAGGSKAGSSCGGSPTDGGVGQGTGTGTGGTGTTGGGGNTGTGTSPGTGAATGGGAGGLPCNIQTILQSRCTVCHGTPLANGAPMPLVTFANLTARSTVFTGSTYAQRALTRMQDANAPMPPVASGLARLSAAEVATFNAWVSTGSPMGAMCGDTTTGSADGGAGGSTGPADGGAASTPGTGGTGGTIGGLPCDVQAVFTPKCTSCHASVPVGGAPMPLVTLANLTARSAADPTMTFAQRTLVRMSAGTMPPAPGAPATSAEIQTLTSWIAAGYPSGTCGATGGTGGAPDPFGTPPKCSSNTFWTGGNSGNPLMNPGRACISCHGSSTGDDDNSGSGSDNSGPGGGGDDDEGGPLFAIAGTVYPSAHEPDLCNGTNGSTTGATIVIVDAANRTLTLTPNAAGNFFTLAAVARPFRAKVVYQGRERIMTVAQTTGDCNSCHTQNGANNAPGRILLP